MVKHNERVRIGRKPRAFSIEKSGFFDQCGQAHSWDFKKHMEPYMKVYSMLKFRKAYGTIYESTGSTVEGINIFDQDKHQVSYSSCLVQFTGNYYM